MRPKPILPALLDRKIQAMSLELATLILRIKVAGLRIQGTNLGPAALVLQKTLAHRIKAMDLGPVAVRRKIRGDDSGTGAVDTDTQDPGAGSETDGASSLQKILSSQDSGRWIWGRWR